MCVHRCATQKLADHRKSPSEWGAHAGYELLIQFSSLENFSLFPFVSLLMRNPMSDLLRSCIRSPQNVLAPNLMDRDEMEKVSAKLMITDTGFLKGYIVTLPALLCFVEFFLPQRHHYSPVTLFPTVIKAEKI